jgi:hypothetical protein
MHEHERTFDVFSGSVDHNPLWLQSVRGLGSALQRMRERAEHAPGPYFVFDSSTSTVWDLVDTSSNRTTCTSIIDERVARH